MSSLRRTYRRAAARHWDKLGYGPQRRRNIVDMSSRFEIVAKLTDKKQEPTRQHAA